MKTVISYCQICKIQILPKHIHCHSAGERDKCTKDCTAEDVKSTFFPASSV